MQFTAVLPSRLTSIDARTGVTGRRHVNMDVGGEGNGARHSIVRSSIRPHFVRASRVGRTDG